MDGKGGVSPSILTVMSHSRVGALVSAIGATHAEIDLVETTVTRDPALIAHHAAGYRQRHRDRGSAKGATVVVTVRTASWTEDASDGDAAVRRHVRGQVSPAIRVSWSSRPGAATAPT